MQLAWRSNNCKSDMKADDLQMSFSALNNLYDASFIGHTWRQVTSDTLF